MVLEQDLLMLHGSSGTGHIALATDSHLQRLRQTASLMSSFVGFSHCFVGFFSPEDTLKKQSDSPNLFPLDFILSAECQPYGQKSPWRRAHSPAMEQE